MLADDIKEYSRIYEERRELVRQSESLGAQLAALEAKIATELDETQQDQVRVGGVSITLNRKFVPKISDKNAFVKWCVDNDRIDMLHKRCTVAAFEEYMEQHLGETPPGTEAEPIKKLNYRNTGNRNVKG